MEVDFLNVNVSSKSIMALDELQRLIEIPRFRKNLRGLLFVYLMKEHKDLMPDFEHFIEDMKFLFEFFDKLEEESGPTTKK